MAGQFYYHPNVFNVQNEQDARAIILTNEGPGADTDTRWVRETPYLAGLLTQHLQPGPADILLDYGCGIGRLAKEMIDKTGCHVIGVDISPDMRRLSVDYVGSEKFTPVSPEALAGMVAAGLKFSGAFSIWVLQHCFAPDQDIAKIKNALRGNGRFFVVNMQHRAVPAQREAAPDGDDTGKFIWNHDDIDVRAQLRAAFTTAAENDVDSAMMPTTAEAGAYWMSLVKTEG